MHIASALAEFAQDPTRPPPEQHAVLQMSILDWMACGRGGVDEPVVRICRGIALEEKGAEQAHLFGGGKVPARVAALVNGATSHALDYDDTHFAHIGHPSVAVLPAVLAIAEREGLSGEAFQNAALIGLEASVRVGIWLGRDHYQVGFHQTATAGAIGATLGCAVAMALSTEQIIHALGLAGTRAAGLKAQFGTMGKPYNAGLAAQTGVEAATLAARGMTSSPTTLEAFATTHSGAGGLLVDTWQFADVSHKFHACCHGLHAFLEALSDLLPTDDLRDIEIHTHPRWMSVCNQPAPITGLGAKFSFRTVAAMAVLGHDTSRPDAYTDALARAPAIDDVRRRITVMPDESLTETASLVRLTDAVGTRLARHDLLTPQALDVRAARVQAKASALLGEAEATRLWRLIQDAAAPAALASGLSATQTG